MSKFYAVAKGEKTGIFNSWNECKKYVKINKMKQKILFR
jgi:viroplasmin and RNaseH domain-containing protein